MNVAALREDFPILKKKFSGKPLVYFDNACMSLRPQPVIEAISGYYTNLSACGGRSFHRLAEGVTDAVEASREKVKRFINANRHEEIIFTRNTTEGLNLVANSLKLKTSDLVITTGKEHNSNLIPWLKKKNDLGIRHQIIPANKDNTFNLDALDDLLKLKPKLVSIVQTSNLDGVSNPVKEIVKRAHKVGALVMVDAAQSAPHQKIDVKDLDVDFLAFSGHKMMGPSGTGILYGKYHLLDKMEGYIVGGDTVDWSTYTDYRHLPLPEKYEAGLQNYAGMIGLGAAVDYLSKIGWENIKKHEEKLNRMITEGIGTLDRLTIIGPKEPELRGGVVAFTVEGVDPHQIALMLDQSATIMVRSGQHCVHSWFADKGIKGSVRASLYVYNTEAEAEFFVEQLRKVLAII